MGWLILAAGLSKRFNGDKLLTQVASEGKTLIQCTLEKYADLGDPLLVVTRPDQIPLHQLLSQLEIDFTISPNSHLGVGSSLAWGVSQVDNAWPWLGIVLGDMALVSSSTLKNLKCVITESNIVLPKLVLVTAQTSPTVTPSLIATNSRSRGHPVLFGRNFYRYLIALEGDSGAKDVLQMFHEYIVERSTEDRGVVFDVDSRLDMEKMVDLLRCNSV